MVLTKILRREPWLTKSERRYIHVFLQGVEELFASCDVKYSPLLSLRVADVAVHMLLVRRWEQGLIPGEEESEKVDARGSLFEQVMKTRERLRKSIKELEDACARLGTPVDTGIAGKVLPLVRQTADLLHAPESAGASPQG
ncbi:MAG: hypothetical protein GX117_06945 [Candidatus Hydrogenedentes bacterium]|nr:hypothetical protein [Candidatus Hydrogenedentota bacterium]